MLPSTLYELRIDATPKTTDMLGREQKGCSFHYTLIWDARVWADGCADSPAALGRAIGTAVRGMAEVADRSIAIRPKDAP